jgi:hypothetical protein
MSLDHRLSIFKSLIRKHFSLDRSALRSDQWFRRKKQMQTKLNTPTKDNKNDATKMLVLDQDNQIRTMVLVPGLGFVFAA